MRKKKWNIVITLDCFYRDEKGDCMISPNLSCKNCTKQAIKRRLLADVLKIEEIKK